ncbi:MAG: xanthine dehydrogenase family protein molybdopterin-binding subunit, partial [Chloroflexi bacterium]|nr:xanthine dehydrogenase family protein molybdopterin-binding subunit [Chloroflexota bacterium]
MPYIGQSIKRFEDPRLVAGQGSYVDDITVPGMLHAAFLRSPYAHARIRSVDASVAREMPGVVAVLTGDDIVDALPDLPSRAMTGEWSVDEFNGPEHPALAIGKVCYVGQPVAIVVAQEPSQARDALETIQTDYEPLTAIMDPW